MSELDGIAEKAERDKQLLDDLIYIWYGSVSLVQFKLIRIVAALGLEEKFRQRIKS